MIQRLKILILLFFPCSISAQQFETKIVNKDTVLVYPIYYDYENYQGLIKDSLPDGKWIALFDDSTSIAFKGNYKNGIPEGLFQYYYKNGKIRYTCIYKDSTENGPFTYWDKDGTIDMIGQNINGVNEGTWYQWYSNGNLRNYYSYINGNREGLDQYYNSDGSISQEGYYSNGYKIGEWKFYHKNGILKEQRFFIDSLTSKEFLIIKKYKNTIASVYFPKGVWKEWDNKGKLIRKTIFNNNYEIEQELEYYPTGELKTEVNFKGFHQGFCSQNPSYYLKNGELKEWYVNGNLKIKGNYLDNKKNGKWRFD